MVVETLRDYMRGTPPQVPLKVADPATSQEMERGLVFNPFSNELGSYLIGKIDRVGDPPTSIGVSHRRVHARHCQL